MFKGVVLAVDGPSGAGKTTLAHALGTAFRAAGRTVGIVQLDSLCGGWDDLDGAVRRAATIVRSFTHRLPVFAPRYDWQRSQWAEARVLAPSEVLILDGCGAACDQVGARWRIWCTAPVQVRRHRVHNRDSYDWSDQWQNWQRQHDQLRYRGRSGPTAGALACQWRYFSVDSASLGVGSYAAKISTTITSVSVPVASSGGMTNSNLDPTR